MTNKNDVVKSILEDQSLLSDDEKAVFELQRDTVMSHVYPEGPIKTSFVGPIVIAVFYGFLMCYWGGSYLGTYTMTLLVVLFFYQVERKRVRLDYQRQIDLLKRIVIKLHEDSIQKKKEAAS